MASAFWRGSQSRINLLHTFSKSTRHIQNIVLTKNVHSFVPYCTIYSADRKLKYRSFSKQSASQSYPAGCKHGSISFLRIHLHLSQWYENPKSHRRMELTHSLWFRHRIELARWNLPQPVKFMMHETLRLHLKVEASALNTNSGSLSLQSMTTHLPWQVSQKYKWKK